MTRQSRGFSLLELLIALMISLALSMMMFQLFHQNERVVRDQTLVMEMQQTARAVASQIADEVRMAGQGVPVYAAAFDSIPSEGSATILATSTAQRIDFRAGLAAVETSITGPVPLDFTLGAPRSVSIIDATGFPSGKFVYVFTDTMWLRAAVASVGSTILTIVPRDAGIIGATSFTSRPAVTLDEAVSIYLSGASVRRATADDMTNPERPGWSAANEIGANIKVLTFTYYDSNGESILPTSLKNRLSIARVDILLTVEVAKALSDGTRPTYSLALRTIPRNVKIRSAQ